MRGKNPLMRYSLDTGSSSFFGNEEGENVDPNNQPATMMISTSGFRKVQKKPSAASSATPSQANKDGSMSSRDR